MINTRLVLGSAGLLAIFALVSIVPVSGLQSLTKNRIAANLKAARLKNIAAVLSDTSYDNDILEDRFKGTLSANTVTIDSVYRISNQGTPVAVVFETTTSKGYSGEIRILVGINLAATVTGVRILEHKETPGLGDAIDTSHSDWVLGFAGKSLSNPYPDFWSVKKDGGEFDQLTGATISPRAVIIAVKESLMVYNSNKSLIFAEITQTKETQ